MSLQALIYLLPYFFSVAISAAVGTYALRRRSVPGALPFAWTALLQAFTAVGFVLELISPSLEAKIFWDNFQFVTLALSPLAFLAFVFEYTGRTPAHPWRTLGLLGLPGAIFLLLLATDDWHGLIRPEAWLVPGEPFAALVYDFTTLVQMFALYSFGLVLVGIVLLALFFVRSPRLYRIQIGIIILGAFVPLIGSVLTLAGVSLGFHRDTAPFTSAIRNLLIGWALFRYHLLDVMPVAWNRVIENMAEAVIVLDARFRIVDLNPAAQRLTSLTVTGNVGKPVTGALAGWPDLTEQCREETTQSGEITLDDSRGQRHLDVSCVPLHSRQGPFTGYVVILRDITERRQAQEALRRTHDELEQRVEDRTREVAQRVEELGVLHSHLEQYTEGLEETVAQRTRELQAERDRTQAILETVGESVIVTDIKGRILYMNPATTVLTGFPRERIVGQHAWQWILDRQSDDPWNEIQQALQAGQIWRGEMPGRREDGTTYDAAVTIAPLFDPDVPDERVGSVWIQRDITPLKEAERLKDQFISNVSHELRSPLSVITLTSDSLDTFYERLGQDLRRSMIGDIREQARVLNELIGDVLEISRIDSGRISTERSLVNLAQQVHGEIEKHRPLADKKSQILTMTTPESLPVWANAGQIGQIIRNLLDNAIKYTPEGGQIQCECLVEDGTRAEDGPGRWAVLRVSDTGIGVEPEHLPHIFERFYRVQAQGSIPGTGLGLSIAQELVELHGGHLTVSSNPGQGTLFSVYLPLGEASP